MAAIRLRLFLPIIFVENPAGFYPIAALIHVLIWQLAWRRPNPRTDGGVNS
jgi:hypothetical protein